MKNLHITGYCFILLLLLPTILLGQRNNIWCFGDSAGIDFNSGFPITITTSLDTRGSCVSIADLNGGLLFYAETRATMAGNTGLIFNSNNVLMQNGDSILGQGWYHELVTFPDPISDSSFYVFSIGVTASSLPGLFYSKLSFTGNYPLGEVVIKNSQLLNMRMVDCLTTIKHGNGRDWWVIARPSPVQQPTYNNIWYTYKITPTGIMQMPIQNSGVLNGTNLGNIGVSPDGSKICFTNLGGLIEIYDFDRCDGLVTNPVTVEPQLSVGPYPYYWSSEFSPSGRYLYVTSSTVNSILWQFDTWAPNITATKTLIWQMTFPPATIGALKRGPDNKIYLSCAWSDSTGIFNYPYPPTAYYTENMNLSVINSPDSAGLACDFQPWSFYLGGKRTYWGLPNNPDYDLGPLVGSPCDTLVGINEPTRTNTNASIHIYYAPDWQTAFINADNLKGTTYRLSVYDLMGKEVFSESGKITPPYYTKNLNCTGWAKGMYVVRLESDSYRTDSYRTEKEKLTKKFVIE